MFRKKKQDGSDAGSSSAFSYESSEDEGYFSYSDLSPGYEENSFDLDSGKITHHPISFYAF